MFELSQETLLFNNIFSIVLTPFNILVILKSGGIDWMASYVALQAEDEGGLCKNDQLRFVPLQV